MTTNYDEPLIVAEGMSLNKNARISDSSDDVALAADGPVDYMGLTYLAMVILGAGTLFPYNTMLSAADYYEDTWPGRDLIFWAPLMASIFTPFTQMAMLKYHSRLNFSLCIICPLIVMTVTVIALPLSPIIITSESTSFVAALIVILILGFASAVLQSIIFSLAAIFPSHFMQAVMAGQGWSGVTACVVRIVTKAVFSSDDADSNRKGALIFFGFSSVFTIICVFTYLVMRKGEYASHYLTAAGIMSPSLLAGSDSSSSGSFPAASGEGAVLDIESGAGAPLSEEAAPAVKTSDVIGKLGWFMCHIVNVFVLTFLVFPGLYTSPKPTFDMSSGWFALLLILEFNICDLIGRTLPRYLVLFTADTVWLGVYLRYLLYPLFFLAAHTQVFASSSWWVIAFSVVFSVSNGYISSLVMMFAPSKVAPHERAAAGGAMSISLVSGILLGSLFALGIQKMTK